MTHLWLKQQPVDSTHSIPSASSGASCQLVLDNINHRPLYSVYRGLCISINKPSSCPSVTYVFLLSDMELLEAMAEVIGNAGAVDHIIRDDSAPAGQCPFIRAAHDKNVLTIEGVEIVLCGGTVANVLTFVASFPVFSQRLPYKARQYLHSGHIPLRSGNRGRPAAERQSQQRYESSAEAVKDMCPPWSAWHDVPDVPLSRCVNTEVPVSYVCFLFVSCMLGMGEL